jgi:hypothetical protein
MWQLVLMPTLCLFSQLLLSLLQVKLLDKLMHHMAHEPQQQVVLLSQVLAAEVNIGYEEMLNTQVRGVQPFS